MKFIVNVSITILIILNCFVGAINIDKSLLNVVINFFLIFNFLLQKKQDNIYKIKASLFLNDQKNLNLEDYVLVTEANGLKFANAKNQFVLNYNE